MKHLVDFVAEKYGDQPCFGQRSDFATAATWSTYRQTRRDTLAFGSALRSILPSRATVGLYGKNSPEWVYSQLACGYFGWVSVPLYDTLGDKAMDYILNQTEISLVVCDTFELAESILKRGSRYLRYLVVIKISEEDRQKLMKKAKDSVTIFTFAEMMIRGLGREEDFPEPNPDDLFLVCYTSGSTGLPKGVMYTHQTFLNAMSTASRIYEIAEISRFGNVHVSFLPLAHIFEQIGMAGSLLYGSQIAFLTTDYTRLLDDYAYYRPTLVGMVPRVLSRMYAAVMEKVNTSKLKARLFERAIKSKLEEQKRGIFKQCGILDSLCFRPIRNRLGGQVRCIVCGGAPLQPEVIRFAKSVFSCPIIEVYGSTESGGMITMVLPTDITGGHAGSVVPDVKIKLIDVPSMGFTVKRDGIGEICAISPAGTPGYYKESEQTKELFDEDGFLRMGDVGRWTENGTLQIVDRCKNIFKLSQGEYVAPEKVEQVYALSPLVLNVYVDGSSLYSYTVAVVVPNFEKIQKLFPELFDELLSGGTKGDSKKYFAEACRQKKLMKLILNDLNKLGAENGLKGFEQVRDLHLSPEPFSIENGLLTPTMKIARPQIRKHFAAQIQALYATGNR
ncbi:Long-chain-fatty-acid--CoA ligase 1 [Clonorchis sinensis]|uniref:long-chain-fatty-acid--CoA ligase n=1 Tax=Clonorchis sinensis TaxID=79923 RepID=A0A419Q106_CLOSI|nr:Long-chain-fatty-acid--CoA ligase 1 [Clonorchis sinensis]